MRSLIKHLSIYFSILFIVCQALAPSVSASSAENFYFEDAIFDFYLSKNSDNTAHLKVRETLKASFPDYDQNHGIRRIIPFTNQGGKNIIIKNKKALNLSVTRNGQPEPFKIDTNHEFSYFDVKIGSANTFVRNNQTYVLEYEFDKVVTSQLLPSKKEGQTTLKNPRLSNELEPHSNEPELASFINELYWNTNGTGWRQPFHKLTANLHISDSKIRENLHQEAWCYVGAHGEKGQNRCQISPTNDGLTFKTTDLKPGENLTFTVWFNEKTFVIPNRPKTYLVPMLFVVDIAFIVYLIYCYRHKYLNKIRDKYYTHKNAPIPPEYTPKPGFTVGEMAENYLKKSPDSRTATILELIIARKIEFIRGDKKAFGKYSWSFKVLSLDSLSACQLALIQFLAATKKPEIGKLYEIKHHDYSPKLADLYQKYDSGIRASLSSRHIFIKYVKQNRVSPLAVLVFIGFIALCLLAFIPALPERLELYFKTHQVVMSELGWLALLAPFISALIYRYRLNKLTPFFKRSEEGLALSRYMDGLKTYISMAEKERLAFTHSVEKAELSSKQIVHLYERLLPYAAIFRLEKTWIKELSDYCEMNELEPPDWYTSDISHAVIASSLIDHSAISAPVDPSPVNPSSVSSSSYSGGGGGGFSGGGGGGGGGGGW